ncbi:MAG: DNA alkylation repair protein, partial [Anaerolineae bacterium]|nr:DNA alkylation repair protein [Anaerolineae bacterium]
MHPYIKPLITLFEQNADPSQAPGMKKYMRDQFEYLGIKSPKFKELLKKFLGEYGLPPVDELDIIVRKLWSLPRREFQYLAVSLTGRSEKQLPPDFIHTLEYLITTKSWWDTVDSLAGGPVGVHFKRYPAIKKKYLAKWRRSDDFWLRRTTLLFQLNYKED